MTILQEMREFLDRHIEDSLENKARNIELICFYYGFGDAELPTLEEVAQKFDRINTREGVRQTKERYFLGPEPSDQIPSHRQFGRLLKSRQIWLASDLIDATERAGLAEGSFSLLGLLRLLKDLDYQHTYDAYDLRLSKLRTSTRDGFSDYYLISGHEVDNLKQLLRYLRNFPKKPLGTKSIARIEDAEQANSGLSPYKDELLEVIRRHPDAWHRERSDGIWYAFEGRQNTLINLARKALTASPECDLTLLAETLRNALYGRSRPYDYPSADLIEDFLRFSSDFEAEGNTLLQPSEFESMPLSDIEDDLRAYLLANGGVSFDAARSFLRGRLHKKRYTESNINRNLFHSPLVFVDKSLGLGNHIYYAIGSSGYMERVRRPDRDRYALFKGKLDALQATDLPYEQKVRREQQILRDSLFAGKTTDACALCGQKFSVQALVAAHKKKREHCTEEERCDPHIVMPLCKFGCDHLYEERHVYVEDEVVRRNPKVPLQVDGIEQAHVDSLVGRELEERWLEGSSSYFYRPEE